MVCARGDQVLLSIFFAGARDDVELGIETACGKDDVDVGGVGGGGRNQSPGAIDVEFAQHMRLRGIANQGEPSFVGIARQFGFVAVDNDKRQRFVRQFAGYAAADASSAADDEVVRQSADLAVHAPPAEYRLQLEF